MAKCVLARDGVAAIVPTGLRQFLLESPRGAYTVMRTVDAGRQIACFDDHVRRLSTSTDAMLHAPVDSVALARRILDGVRNGIALLDDANGDLTIAVLIPTEGHDGDRPVPVWVHLSPFRHQHRRGSVVVEAMRASREQFGSTKDSLWARLRQDLLRAKRGDVNEVVIVDDDDRLLEGLSSNVFVVNGAGVVQTAPVRDGVVAGTIRQVLLSACRTNGVDVVEATPSWNDRFSWTGAFLTSTSRLVLPVHEILDSVSGAGPVRFASIAEIVQRCCALTEADLGRYCRSIYDGPD